MNAICFQNLIYTSSFFLYIQCLEEKKTCDDSLFYHTRFIVTVIRVLVIWQQKYTRIRAEKPNRDVSLSLIEQQQAA